jgi:hypothetical protein
MKLAEFIEKEKRNENLLKYYNDHPGITYRAIGAIFKISGARAHKIIMRFRKEGKAAPNKDCKN